MSTARVTRKATLVTDIQVGDTLVVQDAIIREDGSHKREVSAIRTSARFVWLTFTDGTETRYSSRANVNLGIRF